MKFSEITVESLGELNGAQIFTLNKDELRQVSLCTCELWVTTVEMCRCDCTCIFTIFFKICDDEGNLVYSKLQIQQNLNEQKTGQELNAVLALRKQKSVGDQLREQQHAF